MPPGSRGYARSPPTGDGAKAEHAPGPHRHFHPVPITLESDNSFVTVGDKEQPEVLTGLRLYKGDGA